MKRIRLVKLVTCITIIFLICCNTYKGLSFDFPQSNQNSFRQSKYSMFEPPNNLTDYTVQEIDQYDTGLGFMQDIQIYNDLAVTGAHRGGLVIFNISNFTQPQVICTYDEFRTISEDNLWDDYGGLGYGFDINNDFVYQSKGLLGMVILNISDPVKPQKISQYTDTPINNIVYHQKYVYGLSYPGILIVNVTDPTHPVLANFINSQDISLDIIHDFVIYDNFLYALGSDLVIIDISNPVNTIEVARFTTELGEIVINENRLFILTSPTPSNSFTSTISIINISNPLDPELINDQEIADVDAFVDDIIIDNTTIFVSSEEKLFAFNLSFDYNITFLSSLSVSGSLGEIMVHHASHLNGLSYDLVFCANSRGLQIVDFTNTTQPFLVSVTSLGSRTMKTFVDDDYVYLCTQYEFPSKPSTLHVLMHLNGEIQQEVSSLTFNDEVITDVSVHNHFAFIAGYYNGLIILNLTNPLNPEIIGTFSEGISTTKSIHYDYKRDLVFLANYESGYSIIDVSNKTSPLLLYKNNHWGMSVNDLYVENELLFLTDSRLYGGFGIVNVSDPSNPIHLQVVNLGESIFSIFVEENFLYISSDLTPLYIFDIHVPEEPIFVGELYTGKWFDGYGLFVKDNLIFLAREGNGLMIINVNNPKKPELLVEYRDNYAGLSYDVFVFEEHIFLADGWDGLEVLILNPPLIPLRKMLVLSILPSSLGGIILLVILVSIINQKKKESTF